MRKQQTLKSTQSKTEIKGKKELKDERKKIKKKETKTAEV